MAPPVYYQQTKEVNDMSLLGDSFGEGLGCARSNRSSNRMSVNMDKQPEADPKGFMTFDDT